MAGRDIFTCMELFLRAGKFRSVECLVKTPGDNVHVPVMEMTRARRRVGASLRAMLVLAATVAGVGGVGGVVGVGLGGAGCNTPAWHPVGTAQGSPPQSIATTQSTPWVQTTLYFGLSSPSGRIADKEFEAFLDTAVTPRFPDGFTLSTARGAWRESGSTSTTFEESRVLTLIHPASQDTDEKLDAIRREYRQRFNQQSVLRADTPVRASF